MKTLKQVQDGLIEEWSNSSGITTIDFIRMAVERGAKAHEEATRIDDCSEYDNQLQKMERITCQSEQEEKSKQFFEEE